MNGRTLYTTVSILATIILAIGGVLYANLQNQAATFTTQLAAIQEQTQDNRTALASRADVIEAMRRYIDTHATRESRLAVFEEKIETMNARLQKIESRLEQIWQHLRVSPLIGPD